MKQKAIFFDRDGVLNEAIMKEGKPFAPLTLKELVISAEAKSALTLLKDAGYLLIGATNQPDVARGAVKREAIDAINQEIMKVLPLTEIFVCFHDDKDNCHCRKPLPGLILDAAKKYHVDLSQSFMIGDRWKDVEAGQRAGCKTVWLDHGYPEKSPDEPADFVTHSLKAAALWICASASI